MEEIKKKARNELAAAPLIRKKKWNRVEIAEERLAAPRSIPATRNVDAAREKVKFGNASQLSGVSGVLDDARYRSLPDSACHLPRCTFYPRGFDTTLAPVSNPSCIHSRCTLT